MALSTVGIGHLLAASLSLAAGAFQLVRPRRDALHRRVGYVYVCLMVINNASALTIYKFTGGFNFFHALAVYSLVSVVLAIRPMWVTPRPYQWRRIHYQWIAWSYAGLCAAALTEFLVRVVLLPGWLGAAIGSPPPIVLGGLLIRRFAPPPRAPVPHLTL